MTQSRPESDARFWLRYAGLGVEFCAGLVGCALLGMWADHAFGWSPWGVLVGACVGMVGSMVNLIRQAIQMQRRVESQRRGGSRHDGR